MTKENIENMTFDFLVKLCVEKELTHENLTRDNFYREFEDRFRRVTGFILHCRKDHVAGYVDITSLSHNNYDPDINLYISELEIKNEAIQTIRGEKIDELFD
jgi:hypothetical protein